MKRKLYSFFALLLTLALSLCFFSCKLTGEAVVSVENSTPTQVVIKVEKVYGNTTLFDAMETLQKQGELTFKRSGTMLSELNGVANPIDFSACWMLYTSDREMSNDAWGTIDYNGETLGSAIVGADSLLVLEGEIYVWEYQTF